MKKEEAAMERKSRDEGDGTTITLGDSEFGAMLFDSKQAGDLHLRERSARARPSATTSAPRPGRRSSPTASRGAGEGVDALAARHRQAPRRQAPGHLRRQAALLLRARGAGRGPLPQRQPERRPLVGRRRRTESGGHEAPASQSALACALVASALLAPPAMAAGTTISARGSEFGTMLWGPKRQAVYVFQRDGRGPSRCYGSCARGLAAGLRERHAGRRPRRAQLAARHDAAPRRPAPGHVRRPPALLLRARGARRGALPQRPSQRRPVVGRGPERQAPALAALSRRGRGRPRTARSR